MNNGYNRPHSSVQGDRKARQRALYEEEKRRRKHMREKKMRAFMRMFISVAVFSLIGLIVSLSAIFIMINSDFNKKDKEASSKIVLENSIFYDGKEELDEDLYFYRNGEHYISLSVFTDHFDCTLTGDVKLMTLTSENSESTSFTVGSTAASVNGNRISLSNPTYFSNGQLFVPQSFITKYIENTQGVYSGRGAGRKYIITIPEAIVFTLKNTSTTHRIENISGAEYESTMFTTDVSAYEEYVNPENRDEYLFLVNASHPLGENYIPEDLVDVKQTRSDRAYQKMRKSAAMALEAMFKEMYAFGFSDVTVTSGYRSYEYQQTLFNNEISLNSKYGDKAEEMAAKAVSRPGTSEHQSGLCADLHNLSAASTAFASEDAYKWLYSNCANFGFILRYPKDKTDITGIMFEPWHYRFVGRYHAQKIMQKGLCLEEYMAEYKG